MLQRLLPWTSSSLLQGGYQVTQHGIRWSIEWVDEVTTGLALDHVSIEPCDTLTLIAPHREGMHEVWSVVREANPKRIILLTKQRLTLKEFFTMLNDPYLSTLRDIRVSTLPMEYPLPAVTCSRLQSIGLDTPDESIYSQLFSVPNDLNHLLVQHLSSARVFAMALSQPNCHIRRLTIQTCDCIPELMKQLKNRGICPTLEYLSFPTATDNEVKSICSQLPSTIKDVYLPKHLLPDTIAYVKHMIPEHVSVLPLYLTVPAQLEEERLSMVIR
jgi:hypothetical protein